MSNCFDELAKAISENTAQFGNCQEPVRIGMNRLRKRNRGPFRPGFSSHRTHYAPRIRIEMASLSDVLASISPSRTGS